MVRPGTERYALNVLSATRLRGRGASTSNSQGLHSITPPFTHTERRAPQDRPCGQLRLLRRLCTTWGFFDTMASTSRRRRARDDEDDNDDDGVPSEAPSSSPPSGTSKRRRVDNANDSSDDSPGGRISSAAVAQTNGQGGDGDDFHPGAIVRVTVENFVTYEKAEFFPGPNLNMVIGPNGTGKSSLVCAICLGLGYSPKHLGRAGSVKEFVKHGKDMATIEIELKKKPQDRSNYVIRVQIKREQNSQKWWLNRKETTHKKIHELTRSLKIQVDNLCQFLPQDRVVEFAACGPVELLHETLRAAAPEKMLEWQAQLRDLQKDKKELSEAVSTDADTLKNLETRQQGLQAEVDRLREREEILHAVKTLKMALPVALYREARDDYDKAKKRRKQAERDLKRLEEQSGPSLEAVNEKQAYARAIEMVISDRNRDLEDTAQAVRDRNARLSEAADTMKGFDDKIEATRASHDSHKKNLGISKQKITSLQADLKNKPPEFVAAEWNQKIVSRPAHHEIIADWFHREPRNTICGKQIPSTRRYHPSSTKLVSRGGPQRRNSKKPRRSSSPSTPKKVRR